MGTSKIEWTDKVWNPVTGCTKVSEGCRNCYAESFANRFWIDKIRYQDTGKKVKRPFDAILCHPERLEQPLHWKKPCKIFVCSMADLFHESIYFSDIDCVFNTMLNADQHIYMILTKRPKNLKNYLHDNEWIMRNVGHIWLGVSVEDQKTADERIPVLLSIPAKVHFVSCEPLLETIDLELSGRNYGIDHKDWSERLDWVIVGAESGPKRRKCQLSWIDYIIRQCRESSIPVFIKQIHYCGELIHAKDFNNFFSKGLFPTEFPKE